MTPDASASLVVGNDVVDLGAPRSAAMCGNARFLERVFTESEREHVRHAPAPDMEVWLGWAAKEAAYKVVSKLRGQAPVFVHRAFEVRWDPVAADGPRDGPTGSGPARIGAVHYEDAVLPVRAEAVLEAGYVHALSWAGRVPSGGGTAERRPAAPDGPVQGSERITHTVDRVDRPDAPWSDTLDALEHRLTERERDAVYSLLSAAVRIGARAEAARLLEVSSERVEIVCRPGRIGRRPPTLLVDGMPVRLDVSLSHDGPWIAWALARIDGPLPIRQLPERASP